ncbi:MAG: peptidylprolyl isomerase [Thermoplasmatota archaeon]
MTWFQGLAAAVVVAALFAGCSGSPSSSSSSSGAAVATTTTGASTTQSAGTSTVPTTPGSQTHIVIHTSAGDLGVDLYDDKTPITVANFKQYISDGFYSGTTFYRIVSGFVSQAGGNGNTGTHPAIQNEAKKSGLSNLKYTVAMARTTDPNSATSEFYVNAADNTFLDPGGNSAEGYAVFGIVTAGRDVADRINGYGSSSGQPSQTVTISSITLGAGSSGSPAPPPTTTAAPVCPPAHQLALDAITPGAWAVGGNLDHLMAWVHNQGTSRVGADVTLTGPSGGPLPTGWASNAYPGHLVLEPQGTKSQPVPGYYTYPDWARTMLNLTIPPTQAAGTFTLELHACNDTKVLNVTVTAPGDRQITAGFGAAVNLTVDGHFHANGTRFWQGNFSTVLGSGQTVAGFDWGIVGMRLHETETLTLPPAFAYGWDNPPSMRSFNGQWLDFVITVDTLSPA